VIGRELCWQFRPPQYNPSPRVNQKRTRRSRIKRIVKPVVKNDKVARQSLQRKPVSWL
jgi:hypothetical protein